MGTERFTVLALLSRIAASLAVFASFAALMAAVINNGSAVSNDVKALRSRFTELGYCFRGPEFDPLVQRLHESI